MDIKDAAHFLRNGEKVSKGTWPSNMYLTLSNNDLKIHYTFNVSEYKFNISDILSDDWKIYK